MAISETVLILSILLVVGFLFVWSRCSLSCKKDQENYKRSGLSAEGPMKRSPVDTANKGNGMSANPHYQADKGDKLVPLEYGGVDFYRDDRVLAAGRSFESLDPFYVGAGREATHLVNDSRTRQDMVDAGDMGWHRALNDMSNPSHMVLPSGQAVFTEASFAQAGPADYNRGLYSPSYHNDGIGN